MKKIKLMLVLSLAIFCFLGISQMGFAWQGVDVNGVTICTVAGNQQYPEIVSDGKGGTIITWQDYRNGSDFDIYAQAIDSTGTAKWTTNGVAICTAIYIQNNPQLVSDGQGGAIITWQDYRNGSDVNIYAQAIDSTGSVKWTANGVAICTATYSQLNPHLVSDGQGGAIITWTDYRNASTSTTDIYAQAIDSTGTVKWTTNGVAICTANNIQISILPVSDGQGGAIISWIDYRNGTNYDIYAQAIGSTGLVKWTANGIAICTATDDQIDSCPISDGQGGAIITWMDYRNGTNYTIYAQAIDSTGAAKWTTNGIAICTTISNLGNIQSISMEQGGAIIAWQDYRNGNYDIYTQAIDSTGTVKWTTNGVAICTAANTQEQPQLVSDGQGGAIITWQDYRNGSYKDIYTQAINSTGTVQWTSDGVAICTAANDQIFPQLVSNGHEGAIITWQDYRNGSNNDIYAQSIFKTGLVPVELIEFKTE